MKLPLIAIVLVVASFPVAVSAETALPLTVEQEDTIASLLSELADQPHQFVLKASLRAPNTNYSLEIAPGQSDRFSKDEATLYRSGLVVASDFEEGIEWDGDISCGTFGDSKYPNRYTHVWTHPEGPKPNCLHENTTNHQGTVSVTGTFGVSIYPVGTTSPKYFSARYRVHCSYEGSETGMAECTETLISRKGKDGQEQITPEAPPESVLDDIGDGAGIPMPVTVGIILAALAGVGGLLWYRFRQGR